MSRVAEKRAAKIERIHHAAVCGVRIRRHSNGGHRRRGRYAEASLYYYFDSKETLLTSLVEGGLAQHSKCSR